MTAFLNETLRFSRRQQAASLENRCKSLCFILEKSGSVCSQVLSCMRNLSLSIEVKSDSQTQTASSERWLEGTTKMSDLWAFRKRSNALHRARVLYEAQEGNADNGVSDRLIRS